MLGWIRRKLADRRVKKYHDDVVNKYRDFAMVFGDALSYSYLGNPVVVVGLKTLNEQQCWDHLNKLEIQYAALGYRVIPIDRWIDYGGYARGIDNIWLIKREPDEPPVFTRDLKSDEDEF